MFEFILITLAVGIAGGLLYLIYIPFRSKLLKSGKLSPERSTLINRLYVAVLLIFSVIQTYLGFYPLDSFFFEEFEIVTFRKQPKSGEILKKVASYPDVHGNYCSSSMMQISKEEFKQLYHELSVDDRFKINGDIVNAEEFEEVLDRSQQHLITYFVQIRKPGADYSYIGFMDDNETIVINRCKR